MRKRQRCLNVLRLVLGGACLIAVLALTACGGSDGGSDGATSGGSSGGGGNVDEVKLGVLMPTSGAQAENGRKLRNAAEFAAKEINDSGGIRSLGGAKIKLVIADTQAQPDVGQAAAQRLILQDRVVGLIGAYNSTVTLPVTAVGERYRIPTVVFSSASPEITERGFKYTFRPNETSDSAARTIMDFLDFEGKDTGQPVKTAGIVYESTDFGKPSADAIKGDLAAAGVDVLFDQSYQPGTSDMTPIAVQIKSKKPDLVVVFSVPPDTNVLFKTLNQQQVKAPVTIEYSGTASNDFRPLLSANPGLLSVTQWDASLSLVNRWAAPHVKAYEREYGDTPQPEGLQAYSDVYVWRAALEAAGSTDPEKLRDALVNLRITQDREDPALILPYESIEFDENGQNPNGGLMITQVSPEGRRVGVWPEFVRDDSYRVAWLDGGGS